MPEQHRVELVSPFPAHAWPRVWTWLAPFRRRVFDDLSPRTCQEYVSGQLALERRPEYRSWGVQYTGRLRRWERKGEGPRRSWEQSYSNELGGLIALLQPRGPQDPSAIAQLVLRRDFYGDQIALVAIRQAFGQAFGDGIELIRGEIFADNDSIRSLLLKLGARLYGTLGRNKAGRAAVEPLPNAVRRGQRLTAVIGFALTREDLEDARTAAAQAPPGTEESAPAADDPGGRPVPGPPEPGEEAA